MHRLAISLAQHGVILADFAQARSNGNISSIIWLISYCSHCHLTPLNDNQVRLKVLLVQVSRSQCLAFCKWVCPVRPWATMIIKHWPFHSSNSNITRFPKTNCRSVNVNTLPFYKAWTNLIASIPGPAHWKWCEITTSNPFGSNTAARVLASNFSLNINVV